MACHGGSNKLIIYWSFNKCGSKNAYLRDVYTDKQPSNAFDLNRNKQFNARQKHRNAIDNFTRKSKKCQHAFMLKFTATKTTPM